MKLFTDDILKQLLANGEAQAKVIGTAHELDFYPVVKIFNPYGTGTWLLTEINIVEQDIAFGLCDLGYPEMGSVRISELENMEGPLGIRLERDDNFKADKPLSRYAAEARHYGEIKT